MLKRTVGAFVLAAWAAFPTDRAARATSYPEPLNLEKLTEKAERVLLGEVLARTIGRDPLDHLATVYTFRVEQGLKGGLPPTVTIKQVGVPLPVEDPTTHVMTWPIPGIPAYRPGQRYLLFLNGTSEIGFTSPVGLGYGAFVVLPDGQAVNQLNNAGLFRDMAPPPLPAATQARVQGHTRGPIDLAALVEATAGLVRQLPPGPTSVPSEPPGESAYHVLDEGAARPLGNVTALVNGNPFRWNIRTVANPGGTLAAVPYDIESGPLGNVSNPGAIAKVAESFATWAPPATTALVVTTTPGNLGGDVNAVCPFPTCYQNWYFKFGDGKNPIIFDTDGSITNLLTGSRCGFGGLGGTQGVTSDGGISFTLESTVVLDGAWLGGACGNQTLDQFGVTITHELGHFLGIDHTIVNGELVIAGEPLLSFGVPPCSSVEMMLSNAVPGCSRPNVLQKDDIAIVSFLYPSATFAATTGRINGRLFAPDGTTPVNCGNMILRNVNNLFFDAVATITGISKDFGTPPPTQAGSYRAPGLTLGASYIVRVTELPAFATGGSNITDLCDPVLPLPGPEEFYNGGQESADPAIDNPNCFVPVVAGISTTGIDVILNSGASSAAPCTSAQLGLTATVNRTQFAPGQTLVAAVGVTNPGLPAMVDFHLGVLLPDGDTIVFFTNGGSGVAFGRASSVATFRPVAAGVSLASPFAVTAPNFFVYTRTGSEPRGACRQPEKALRRGLARMTRMS